MQRTRRSWHTPPTPGQYDGHRSSSQHMRNCVSEDQSIPLLLEPPANGCRSWLICNVTGIDNQSCKHSEQLLLELEQVGAARVDACHACNGIAGAAAMSVVIMNIRS